MNRFLEWLLAAAGLVLALPVLAVLVPVIRLASPGPALFRQERVGRNRERFTLYKLRTMTQGTVQAGTHEVSAAAVTPVGRFLRASKLDELPQLINVVRGEMALVGPRPCLPVQEELIEEREKRGVFALRPGITGLGQVRGIDMSDPVRLAECDAEYVARRSFAGDVRLLWQTVRGEGKGDRVAG